MPPAIPDRWIPYKACGNVIEGTRFICFKVPLKKSAQSWNKAIKEIWDVPALLEKIPTLGAVIDLTNTARYYNPEELQSKGVLHKKILMPGRIIPPEDKVTEFMDTVDEFLGKDCESLIGVHCTHGLNRTGYMVCRYMRDRLGVPAKDAIKKFEKARGYQIERENYIADLLGTTPPPPDVGKETDIKPVSKKQIPYKRSPLVEDEDVEEANRNRDRYNRYNRVNNRNNDRFNSSGGSGYNSGSRRSTGNDSDYRRDTGKDSGNRRSTGNDSDYRRDTGNDSGNRRSTGNDSDYRRDTGKDSGNRRSTGNDRSYRRSTGDDRDNRRSRADNDTNWRDRETHSKSGNSKDYKHDK